MQTGLTKDQILRIFDRLKNLLSLKNTTGKIYLVGWAIMSLVYNERDSTKDLDEVF